MFLRDKKQKNKRKKLKKFKRKSNFICGKFERKSNRKYDLAHAKNFCPEQSKKFLLRQRYIRQFRLSSKRQNRLSSKPLTDC